MPSATARGQARIIGSDVTPIVRIGEAAFLEAVSGSVIGGVHEFAGVANRVSLSQAFKELFSGPAAAMAEIERVDDVRGE